MPNSPSPDSPDSPASRKLKLTQLVKAWVIGEPTLIGNQTFIIVAIKLNTQAILTRSDSIALGHLEGKVRVFSPSKRVTTDCHISFASSSSPSYPNDPEIELLPYQSEIIRPGMDPIDLDVNSF